MRSIKNYKSLILEMETSRLRLKCIKEQMEQLTKLMYAFVSPVRELKAMIYDDMPKGGCSVEYERLLEAMRILENLELIENTILEGMTNEEKLIDDKLKIFDDLEYKVAYLRAKGKSLQEIATELNHTLGYIQNISAKINKKDVSCTI